MNKIFAFLAVFALVCAVPIYAQQGGFHVDTVQAKDDGKNNGFLDRVDLEIQVYSPTYVYTGQEMWVDFEIYNYSGRAIPDITAWLDPKFKKFDKNGVGLYDGGYISGGRPVGKADKYGIYPYSASLSDGGTLYFSIYLGVAPDTAGPITFDDIEIWTRLGNKNFQDQLYGGLRGDSFTIDVLKPEESGPTFPQGIETDKDGNLIIWGYLLDGAVPNNSNFGGVIIDFQKSCLSGASDGVDGSTVFSYNGDRIKIEKDALADGFYTITAWRTAHGNRPASNGEIAFRLIMENGFPVGAYIVCADCFEAKEDCTCE